MKKTLKSFDRRFIAGYPRNEIQMDGGAEPPVLNIGREVLKGLAAMAGRTPSAEICGILMGRRSLAAITVDDVVASPNVTTGDQSCGFEIDQRVLVRTLFAHRRGHWDVVGFYHSHPQGDTTPSGRDHAAAWAGMSYLIIASWGAGRYKAESWWMSASGAPLTRQPVISNSECSVNLATEAATNYDR